MGPNCRRNNRKTRKRNGIGKSMAVQTYGIAAMQQVVGCPQFCSDDVDCSVRCPRQGIMMKRTRGDGELYSRWASRCGLTEQDILMSMSQAKRRYPMAPN